MPKTVDGVSMPERRRSIRNIPIPEGRRKTDKIFSDTVRKVPTRARLMEEEVERNIVEPPKHHRRKSRKNLWISVGVGALIVVFALLSIFNGATLAYTPKSSQLTFSNDTFTASKTGEDKLLYSVVKLSGEKGMMVPASGTEEVSKKASGTIIVYNNASADAQTLVATTRFESPEGKIYRIDKSITVPGKKGTTPGSVEATVYADQPGESYNISPTDFTLPGLKGTPKYTTVYARGKTPISGGFVGTAPKVTSENLSKAKDDLKAALSQELIAKAQAEVPADFILSPSLSSVTFEDMPQTASNDKDSATVNLRGNLYGIMFKKSDLAGALAEEKLGTSKDEPIDLLSFDTLQLAFAGTPPADLLPLSEINFKVSGTATVVWRTDEVALKSDLVGRSKRDIPSVLKNYPTIASADATLRPFWKTVFPESADKITIKKLKVE